MTYGSFTIAACVNNDEVLRKNLLRSPGLLDGGSNQLITKTGFRSASVAYNSALDEAAHDIVIFAHQDIYFPEGWFDCLRRALATLETHDPNWGVLGVYGFRKGGEGGRGRIY